MKTKLIIDDTFKCWFRLVWDCNEIEFLTYLAKKYDCHKEPIGALGLNATAEDGSFCLIWINRKDNVESLSHEILHTTRFWLQDFLKITMSQDTEEIYTMLHSFFMRESLKALDLKRLSNDR
jgi:hypothetical protein